MAGAVSHAVHTQREAAHVQALWAAALAVPVLGGLAETFWISAGFVALWAIATALLNFTAARLEPELRAGAVAILAAAAAALVPARAALILVPAALMMDRPDLAQVHRGGPAWVMRRAARASWLVVYLFTAAAVWETLGSMAPQARLCAKLALLACAWAAARRWRPRWR